MASIVIVSGPNEGQYYPLGARTLVVGRGENCPVQINDGRVSRKHLQLRNEGEIFLASDMKSANGTLINGRDLTADVELVDGDELTVGESKIVFWMREFEDRESAFNHWKERGQRFKPTIPQ